MGFPAFAENPIFIFLPPHPCPFDRGVCSFLGIYAVQRIHTPFLRPFSIHAVPEIWGAPHTGENDGVRQSNFVICPYGHIFAYKIPVLFALHSIPSQQFYIVKNIARKGNHERLEKRQPQKSCRYKPYSLESSVER